MLLLRRVLFTAIILMPLAGAPAGAQPLVTGIKDPAGPGFDEPDLATAYRTIAGAGATTVRMPVAWTEIAPKRPANAADLGDAAYRWTSLDARVTQAATAGLHPILSLYAPPQWAIASPGRKGFGDWPDPVELERFAESIARRYNGGALPAVRHWQVWNEPNLDGYLDQSAGDAPARYGQLVNAVADGVKRVAADNLVIAGGLGPFGGPGTYGSRKGAYGTRPLPFMRRLLCVRAGAGRAAACNRRTRFDIWAHHPYTSGGPTHQAIQPGDASLGDLPQMRRILRRAERSGSIRRSGRVRFWVTEFSWDSSPPDREGLPLRLHARWVAEALFRMWKAGVSQVTWFQLRDMPLTSIWQSGLYLRGPGELADAPAKPALRAFRFPFVAYRAERGVKVWGRTPASDARTVVIEQRRNGRWVRSGSLRSGSAGIFAATVRGSGTGAVRARLAGRGDSTAAFSLRRPRDRFVNPFGSEAAPEDA